MRYEDLNSDAKIGALKSFCDNNLWIIDYNGDEYYPTFKELMRSPNLKLQVIEILKSEVIKFNKHGELTICA